jgi:hypothetical protein
MPKFETLNHVYVNINKKKNHDINAKVSFYQNQ